MAGGSKFCSGYRHSSRSNDIKVFVPTVSMVWGTGCQKQASSGNGVMQKLLALSGCSVTGIQGSGKHMLSNLAGVLCLGKDDAGVAHDQKLIVP